MEILSTERLHLRRVILGDAPDLYRLMNDKDWLLNIGDREVYSVKDAENYIESKFDKTFEEKGFGFFAVTLKTNKEFIGIVGLVDRDGLDHVDIGYGILPEFRGKGYAYEASKAIYDYGQRSLQIDKIVAIVNADNQPSITVLKKLGLQFEKMIQLPDENKEIMLFS